MPELLGHSAVKPLSSTELYQEWKNRVVYDDNDFVVCVAASSRTAISGTGKSTLGISLCREFDNSATDWSAEEKATLHAEEATNELYPNLPTQSSILFDESQGTLDSDGVDSRRAMADSVVRMSRATAQYRKRQHSLVIVAQSTDWIDSRMMEMIDRLVLIQEKHPDAGWARAVSFDHYRKDLPGSGRTEERTPSIEDIAWEPLTASDPDYQVIDKLKEQVGDAVPDDPADEEQGDPVKTFAELSVDQRNQLMGEVYEQTNVTQEQLAEIVDLTQQTVQEILADKRKEYRQTAP
jgi:predicted XRE-type DNA-binding protein